MDFAQEVPERNAQLVLVSTADWPASRGTLRRFERSEARAPWREIGKPMAALLGRRGLAWGLGMRQSAHADGPRKVEGDDRSPAGLFELGTAFGQRAPDEVHWLRLPYLQLTSATQAVDDPASRYYGRIVDRTRIEKPDWRSSEPMGRIPAYELGIVIEHNPRHVPSAGSCIFLHLWLNEQAGTSGCTALHRADLIELMRWLDPAKHPVILQLPLGEAAKALAF